MKTQKTKKSMKKKALLSSVSMLMVATVAIGSATFAWFTTNPTANAEGLKMKATAAKGLVIHTESNPLTNSWRHTDYLNSNNTGSGTSTSSRTLDPVSFDLTNVATKQLADAYMVEAIDADTPIASGVASVSNATTGANTYSEGAYYQEKIYCKVNGGGESGTLKLTGLNIETKLDATMANGLRFAIQYVNHTDAIYDENGSTVITPASDVVKGLDVIAPVANTKNGYMVAQEGYTSGTTKYSAFNVTALDADNDTHQDTDKNGNLMFKLNNNYDFGVAPTSNVELGEVDTTGKDYVLLTIYLDGEDANVFSDNIDIADILTKVDVQLRVD